LGKVSNIYDIKRNLAPEGLRRRFAPGRVLFRQLLAAIRAERQHAEPPAISKI
jgi:hypothetical protein